MMNNGASTPATDAAMHAFPVDLFPLIRTNDIQHRLFLERKRVCGFYDGRLISAIVHRKLEIPLEAHEPDGADALQQALARGADFFDIAVHRMESVDAELDSDATRDTLVPTVRFLIRVTESDAVLKFHVLLAESPHIIQAFAHFLGARFTVSDDLGARFETRQMKRLVRDETNRAHARTHAGTEPFRSRPVGLLLIGIGVLVFGLAGWLLINMINPENNFLLWLVGGLLALLLGTTLVQQGQGIAAPRFEEVMAKAKAAPILYLRSFKSEDSDIPPRTATFRDDVFGRLLARAWPIAIVVWLFVAMVRFVRFVTGTGSQRVEERIAPILQQFGPLVAIGRPGDPVASLGAARAYVDDDSWQQFIIDMLDSAQMVVIQVESTDGTWWEFTQAMQRVPPERLLMMFTARYASFQHYEEVRLKAATVLPKPLPRVIGNSAFLYFDKDWNAYPLALAYHNRVVAPLAASPVNWRKSLARFCEHFRTIGSVRSTLQ